MAFTPTLRLEAPGLQSFAFDDAQGIVMVALDLGDAEVRAVSESAPDADGTIDTTAFTGARSVAIHVRFDGTTWATRQLLRAYTAPKLRPTLIFQLAADAPIQQVTLRRGSFSDVIDEDFVQNGVLDVTVQWVAPLGVLESNDLHTFTIWSGGDGTPAPGRTYPLVFARSYPAALVQGTGPVINGGSADAYPLVKLYGPATNPAIDNSTQGRSITFTGLTIAVGEYLEIDLRNHTVRMNGDPLDSRYSSLDFATSAWWTLSPGLNMIRFHPTTSTAAVTAAVGTYRDAYQ